VRFHTLAPPPVEGQSPHGAKIVILVMGKIHEAKATSPLK